MKVSVLTITYNHEDFIGAAIESVMAQKSDCAVEMVIGEDCSTDRTREIIAHYTKLHPGRIRLLPGERNLGMLRNYERTWLACDGDYIAVLDGDDYWCSPDKLQKQVACLESNPEWAACFHRTRGLDHTTGAVYPYAPSLVKDKYTLAELALENIIQQCSIMYRGGLLKAFPEWWHTVALTDWTTHLLHAQCGDFGFLNEEMAVHRIHPDGAWWTMGESGHLTIHVRMYQLMLQHMKDVDKAETRRRLSRFQYQLAEYYARERNVALASRYARGSFRTLPFNRSLSQRAQLKNLVKFNLLYLADLVRKGATSIFGKRDT